jgi:hypothetical protein
VYPGTIKSGETPDGMCKVIRPDRTDDNPLEVVTPEGYIRGVQLRSQGILPIYRTEKGGPPQEAYFPVPVVREGLVCLDRTATTLFVWPLNQPPFLMPLTWLPVDAPSGTDARAKQSGWSAIPEVLLMPSSEYSRKLAVGPSSSQLEGFGSRVYSLKIEEVRGFTIRLGDLPTFGQDLHFTYIVGINRSEPVSDQQLPEIYGPSKDPPGCSEESDTMCIVKGLSLGGDRPFILQRSKSTQECSTPREACLQELRLFAANQGDYPVLRFRKLDHYSAAITNAATDGGYLFLWDAAGQKWRYTIGWPQLRELIQNSDLSGNLRTAASTPGGIGRHRDFATPLFRSVYLSEICLQAECYTWPRDSYLAKASRWADAWADTISRWIKKFTTPIATGTPAPLPAAR